MRVSSQSSGFLASGSGMVFGGRKSQSSSRLPPSARLLSILTSYVLSDRTISVYKWVNSSSYGGREGGERGERGGGGGGERGEVEDERGEVEDESYRRGKGEKEKVKLVFLLT